MGETALDEQIFEEYLAEMRDYYNANKVCFLSLRLLSQLTQHLTPCNRAVSYLG